MKITVKESRELGILETLVTILQLGSNFVKTAYDSTEINVNAHVIADLIKEKICEL